MMTIILSTQPYQNEKCGNGVAMLYFIQQLLFHATRLPNPTIQFLLIFIILIDWVEWEESQGLLLGYPQGHPSREVTSRRILG
jgi:hypothetical protein